MANKKEEQKNRNPLIHFDEYDCVPKEMKAFISSIVLSYKYRRGWLAKGRNIQKKFCESVAEHVFGMILLDEVIQHAFPEYYKQFDPLKVFQLIKRHELPEINEKDYTPGDKLDKKTKHKLEQDALHGWLELVSNSKNVRASWDEYEAAETPEAKYVHVLDYLQRAIRARLYEVEFNKDLSEFYADRKEKIPQPLLGFFESILDIQML